MTRNANARFPRSYRWGSAVDDSSSASILGNTEVLWSPEANRFAITGSAQGANGTDMTAVADVMPDGIRWTGLTALVEKAFGHPVKARYAGTVPRR